MDVLTASAFYARLCALADGFDRQIRDLPACPQRVALEALTQELDALIDVFVQLELAYPQSPTRHKERRDTFGHPHGKRAV